MIMASVNKVKVASVNDMAQIQKSILKSLRTEKLIRIIKE